MRAPFERTFFRIVSLGLLATLHSPVTFAVRNGVEVPSGRYLSVGYLTPACTATLIGPQTLLTAAHCVQQGGGFKKLEFLYWTSMGEMKTLKAIDGKILSKEESEELAVVHLEDVARGASVMKLWRDQDNQQSDKALIIGYGASEQFPRNMNRLGGFVKFDGETLVNRPVMDATGEMRYLQNPMLEVTPADGRSQITCAGDSGGPLIVDGGLIGIASFALSSNPSFYFLDPVSQCKVVETAHYIPVAKHAKWIEDSKMELEAKYSGGTTPPSASSAKLLQRCGSYRIIERDGTKKIVRPDGKAQSITNDDGQTAESNTFSIVWEVNPDGKFGAVLFPKDPAQPPINCDLQ